MTNTFTISQTKYNKKQTIYPIKNDIYTDFIPNGETEHINCINDEKKNIDNDITYISTKSNSNVSDAYFFEPIGESAETIMSINSIKLYSISKTDIPPISTSEYKLMISNDGWNDNIDISNNNYLLNNYYKYINTYSNNPFTSNAFSEIEINNLCFGIQARSDIINTTDLSIVLRPNAAGDKTNASKYPNIGESNFEDVDDVTCDNLTTYIYAQYPDNQHPVDLYNIQSVNDVSAVTDGGTIESISIVGVFQTNGIGIGCVYGGLKINGTENWKTSEQKTVNFAGTSWGTYSWTWTTNPDTLAIWNWSDLENLQIGIDILHSANAGGKCICSQLYLIVNYNVSAITPEIRTTAFYADIFYDSFISLNINNPENISTNHTRNVNMLNFWNGEREVYSISRNNKTLILNGFLGNDNNLERTYCASTTTKEGTMTYHMGGEAWSNVANAYDSNYTTYCSMNASDDCLFYASTINNIPSDANISNVYIRYYFYGSAGVGDAYEVRLKGKYFDDTMTGTLDVKFWANSSSNYDSGWKEVPEPAGGWTREELYGLRIYVYGLKTGSGWARLKEVEIKVEYNEVETYSCCDIINIIRNMGKNGDDVTISGLNMYILNDSYKIRSFGWKEITHSPPHYEWILELEYVD